MAKENKIETTTPVAKTSGSGMNHNEKRQAFRLVDRMFEDMRKGWVHYTAENEDWSDRVRNYAIMYYPTPSDKVTRPKMRPNAANAAKQKEFIKMFIDYVQAKIAKGEDKGKAGNRKNFTELVKSLKA